MDFLFPESAYVSGHVLFILIAFPSLGPFIWFDFWISVFLGQPAQIRPLRSERTGGDGGGVSLWPAPPLWPVPAVGVAGPLQPVRLTALVSYFVRRDRYTFPGPHASL